MAASLDALYDIAAIMVSLLSSVHIFGTWFERRCALKHRRRRRHLIRELRAASGRMIRKLQRQQMRDVGLEVDTSSDEVESDEITRPEHTHQASLRAFADFQARTICRACDGGGCGFCEGHGHTRYSTGSPRSTCHACLDAGCAFCASALSSPDFAAGIAPCHACLGSGCAFCGGDANTQPCSLQTASLAKIRTESLGSLSLDGICYHCMGKGKDCGFCSRESDVVRIIDLYDGPCCLVCQGIGCPWCVRTQ